jgi:ribosome-binding ATPase YchF (GTP1/OBG family)
VNMIAQVVRCFDDDEIVHVHGRIDPLDDMEVINLELILADLQSAEKRLDKAKKMARAASDKDTRALVPVLEKLVSHLGEGLPARSLELGDEEKRLLKAFPLITGKSSSTSATSTRTIWAKPTPWWTRSEPRPKKKGLMW